MGQVEMDIDKIVQQVLAEIKRQSEKNDNELIPVGVSNKHIHLSIHDLEVLFGKGYKLTKTKDLQPGQYAAKETVTVIGPKGFFNKVRILGPVRKESQLEISISDSFTLGVKSQIRESGNIKDTPGILLRGPKGEVQLDKGVIVASRHIHLSSGYAKKYGYKDGELVSVTTNGLRKTTLHNVTLRVADNYSEEIHIDVEETNASGLKNGDLIKITREAV
jgi:putative phosphotransacetylase